MNLPPQFGPPAAEPLGPLPGEGMLDPGSPGMDGGVSPSSGSGSDRLSSIPSLQALQAAAASQAGSEGEQEVDTFLEQVKEDTEMYCSERIARCTRLVHRRLRRGPRIDFVMVAPTLIAFALND